MSSNKSQQNSSKKQQQQKKKPPIPHCRYKDSAAARLTSAFTQLCRLLDREWASIRSLNLGVKSGTGVIDDVLYCQLQQLASTVHLLAVTDAEASSALVGCARGLSTQQFQNLQVLLDGLCLEELSDFLRLMCCNPALHHSSSNDSSSGTDSSSTKRPSTSTTAGAAGALGQSKEAAAGSSMRQTGHQQASTTPARRMRAAAGTFELSHASFSDAAPSIQQLVQQQQLQQGRGSGGGAGGGLHGGHGFLQLPHDTGLKFAHLLPAGHILVKTARALQQQQQFQAALAAATPPAAAPPHGARPRAYPGVPLLQLPVQGDDQVLTAAAGDVRQQQQQELLSPHVMHGDGRPSSSSNSSRPTSSRSNSQQPQLAQQPVMPHPHHPSPWRGSWLLEGMSCSHDTHQPHVTAHGPLGAFASQQHPPGGLHHPGAFFLSTHGAAAAAGSLRAPWALTGTQQQQQHQQQQAFRAPAADIEQLWKAGRAATAGAVLAAAHLPVHDSPGDALSLLLAPGLVVQAQQQQKAAGARSSPQQGVAEAAEKNGASRSRLTSRRASAVGGNSRPVSARNPRQGVSGMPPLQLNRVETGRGDVVGTTSRPGTARPGSAAVSSRLGPGSCQKGVQVAADTSAG